MTTVIRVRRKRTTDALENLVLPLKRAKVNKPTGTTGNQAANTPLKSQDDNKAVFTFAGTVERKVGFYRLIIYDVLQLHSLGYFTSLGPRLCQFITIDMGELFQFTEELTIQARFATMLLQCSVRLVLLHFYYSQFYSHSQSHCSLYTATVSSAHSKVRHSKVSKVLGQVEGTSNYTQQKGIFVLNIT